MKDDKTNEKMSLREKMDAVIDAIDTEYFFAVFIPNLCKAGEMWICDCGDIDDDPPFMWRDVKECHECCCPKKVSA